MEVKCRRLEGKVAVVTASTQGIGLAIAERLGLEGAAVVISSRKKVQLKPPPLSISFVLIFASPSHAAEERRRGGRGPQGEGDHRRRGGLPCLHPGAAQEPHRHGGQGENWGFLPWLIHCDFLSVRWLPPDLRGSIN